LFEWKLNIAGPYRDAVKSIIGESWDISAVTLDNDKMSTYQLLTRQTEGLSPTDMVFLWQEDHWFVCPSTPLFLFLLDKFESSGIDSFDVTHGIPNWERVIPYFSHVEDHRLYTVCQMDLIAQKRVWEKSPGSFVTGIPSIYKMSFFHDIMDVNRTGLSSTTAPLYCEMDAEHGRRLLEKRDFTKLIPTFHILREVYWGDEPVPPRRIDVSYYDALEIIRLRDGAMKPMSAYVK